MNSLTHALLPRCLDTLNYDDEREAGPGLAAFPFSATAAMFLATLSAGLASAFWFPFEKTGFPFEKTVGGHSPCPAGWCAHTRCSFPPGQVSCLRPKKGTHPSAVDSTLLAYSGILFWSFFLTSLLRSFPTEYKHAIISSSLKKKI